MLRERCSLLGVLAHRQQAMRTASFALQAGHYPMTLSANSVGRLEARAHLHARIPSPKCLRHGASLPPVLVALLSRGRLPPRGCASAVHTRGREGTFRTDKYLSLQSCEQQWSAQDATQKARGTPGRWEQSQGKSHEQGTCGQARGWKALEPPRREEKRRQQQQAGQPQHA